MVNQLILVGKLVKEPTIEKMEDGKRVGKITIAITRNYKNEDGIYETDFADITLWNEVADKTSEFCKIGDLIGIKGRIQSKDGSVELVAEKVTFLASSKK